MSKAEYIGIPNNPTVTLPSGYTQLEYIESSGTQWINTGYLLTSQYLSIECDFSIANMVGTCPFAGGETNKYIPALHQQNASAKPSFWVGSTGNTCPITINSNERTVVSLTANNGTLSVTVNGSTQTSSYSDTMSTSYPVIIFGQQQNASTIYQLASMKLYRFKLWGSSGMVRDFIPAKNSSGVIGLYDLVNSKFYQNSGTGTFKAGTALDGKSRARKVNKMYVGVAETFKVLEYIQSSGTQYIDTGFKPNNNTRIVMDFESMSSGVGWFFGARTDTKSKTFSLVQISNTSIRNDNGSTQSTITIDNSQKRTIIDRNGATLSFGSYSVSNSAETFSCDYTLSLFGVNHAGTIESDSRISGKLYSCQIYDNGSLVRNFVPVKKSDGTIGLYDTVNSKFYANAGSGTFTAGTSLSTEYKKDFARKVKKAYIGVNGIARLFFGGSTLKYKGVAPTLSYANYGLKGATVGNYAIFAGGTTGKGGYYDVVVNAYDGNLTKRNPASLDGLINNHTSGSVGNYALFAGGVSLSAIASVTAYDNNLTKSSAPQLSTARSNLAGASVGDYALFAGGEVNNVPVNSGDAYNSSLSKSTFTLSNSRRRLTTTTVGNYALFAGGQGNSSAVNYVEAVDSSLTRKDVTALSEARYNMSAATVGNYAIIFGYSVVDVYDKSLTKIAVNVGISHPVSYEASASLDGYALFAGGYSMGGLPHVYAFDESLTATMFDGYNTDDGLSVGRGELASVVIGNYALFAGGRMYNTGSGASTYYNTVDVYEVA